MKKVYLLLTLLLVTKVNFAQHKCSSHDHLLESLSAHPERQQRLDQFERYFEQYKQNGASHQRGGVLTIPVVVHVLWNTPEQNILDEQIQSQIQAMNEDFRLLNFDAPTEEHPFYFEAADAGIEFCLAQQDPEGNLTDGINRVWTPIPEWTEELEFGIKYSDEGGADNWDPESYLNIWVVTFEEDYGTLGYATFPDELSENPYEDGVVIRSNAFGYVGTVTAPNDLGRTATHEVGHWLNLRHIWGDDICGDDFVDDTPTHFDANFGCPDFPHNAFSDCGTDELGEMYMNYMDYVDDNCMNMFSYGQADRMWFALETYRFGLFNSTGCEPGIETIVSEFESDAKDFICYPNPATESVRIDLLSSNSGVIELTDMLGRTVFIERISTLKTIDVSNLVSGVYTVRLSFGDHTSTQKILVQ